MKFLFCLSLMTCGCGLTIFFMTNKRRSGAILFLTGFLLACLLSALKLA